MCRTSDIELKVLLRMEEFVSRAAGGFISVFSLLIRATTDRHQRSVINNVYYLTMTKQLIRQKQPSTVPVHPALKLQPITQHTCWSPSTARMPGHRVSLTRHLLHSQATIRLTSKLTIFPMIRPVTHGRHIL